MSETVSRHEQVLERALAVHIERSADYGTTWKVYGWRGSLFQLRAIVERSWGRLWNAPHHMPNKERQLDAMLDLINYAVYTYINIEDNNRDGEWNYDE
jgi:hypothetical protein